ncbi:MAG: KUP/HAK/KT family potassium transporter [Myxococcaceae bacterium]|nr:KUP/HAK/KT family potassium transporter [Myxococcaceae bacterium]
MSPSKTSFGALTLGALGVVFGDIGTSPLYTLRECLREVSAHTAGGLTHEDVLGVLSLIFWSLMLVVTVKYLSFIMRADNEGEGGIFALLALVPDRLRLAKGGRSRISFVAVVVVIGAALLYGDGAITPAISVLSALEGITVLEPHLQWAVVPATCGVLLLLFAMQSRGTGSVGTFFGPIMVVWFVTIGGLGAWHVAQKPEVLAALLPHHAVRFFMAHGMPGFLVLGSVVLAVTGGEALYADMGHFGVKPIRFAWLAVALPALLLCYFGQGAMVLQNPELVANPFFSMVPQGKATVALIILSSAATVIASQALISGAFSLTRQAQQLGYFPRVTVQHTAANVEGQIYIPQVNWLLAVGCLLLVLGFQKSEHLASAYGIAVTGTMMLTSIVFWVVMRHTWKWSALASGGLLALFLAVDIPFFAANTAKIADGGWVPVMIGLAFIAAMLVWSRGRTLLSERYAQRSGPLDETLERIETTGVQRVPGTAVFMASSSSHTPPVLMHVLDRVRSLHERVLLLTVVTEPVPHVAESKRVEVTPMRAGFTRVLVRYGFMDEPDVPAIVKRVAPTLEPPLESAHVTYVLGREAVLGHGTGAMGRLAEGFFGFLQRNAVSADQTFKIPPGQAIEIGIQVDL